MTRITWLAQDLRACDHWDNAKIKPFAVYWLQALLYTLKWLFLSTLCKWRGHQYEDAGSYAGSESAADDFTCARCGHSFHYTYF